MTILRTGQCPYIDDAAAIFMETADERGIPCREVEFISRAQVPAESPTAYGTFGVVPGGRVFSYHYLTKKELITRLDAAGA